MAAVDDQQLWDFYNGLLMSPDVERIRKLLVRYDLFRLSLDIPGDVVECGVFKGAGLMYWLKLLHIFSSGSTKRVVGFDTFGSFADSLLDYERKTAGAYVTASNFEGVDPEDIRRLAEAAGLANRLDLVAGDLGETGPKYTADNPGFRISLLHLDLDAYAGTKAALESLWPRVSRGGIVVLDEYGARGWGESQAVDEYFAGQSVEIRAVPNASQPTAYIVKP